MQIFEVKNNLVKVNYDIEREKIFLAGFAVVKNIAQSFIGQIIHLEANIHGNFAIIKLLFTFDSQGVISNYNGAIPDVKSFVETINSQELLELLPVQNPILLGELAQQNVKLNLDRNFLENKTLVCCENQEDIEILIYNLSAQLAANNKKVLIFDLNGSIDFSDICNLSHPSVTTKIIASENFKLPLNYETINFIYNGLDDAAAETKALIQEVFLEVQNYVKTLPEKFIPFETFKNVVDQQYEEVDIVELLLLKNRLLKYHEEGIFAQSKEEFDSLKNSLNSFDPTIINLSRVDEQIQREVIAYTYSILSQLKNEVYAFVHLNDMNSNKKLLKQIFTSQNVYSTVICPYSFKYLNELKQLSKNLIFFTPIQQQNDFAIYNNFLNKLNPHEFIIYGKSTQNMPMIVKLEKNIKEVLLTVSQKTSEISQEELLDQEIKKDVDEIFMPPKKNKIDSLDESQEEFSEEDLDFIDDIGLEELEQNVLSQEENEEMPDISNMNESIQIDDKFTMNPPFEEISENTVMDIEQSSDEEEIVQEEEIQTQEFLYDNEEENKSFSDVLNEQEIPKQEPPAVDILPANLSSTPIVPVYSADIEPQVESDHVEQGDIIMHPKYGKGTVEKLISYGSKTLCSINFDNVGRRLLDPNLSELKKV